MLKVKKPYVYIFSWCTLFSKQFCCCCVLYIDRVIINAHSVHKLAKFFCASVTHMYEWKYSASAVFVKQQQGTLTSDKYTKYRTQWNAETYLKAIAQICFSLLLSLSLCIYFLVDKHLFSVGKSYVNI